MIFPNNKQTDPCNGDAAFVVQHYSYGWHAWGRREKCARCWTQSPKERDHSDDQGVDGSMVSEWILGRLAGGGGGVDSVGSGYGPVAGCCKCGNEHTGSGATELVTMHGYLTSLAWKTNNNNNKSNKNINVSMLTQIEAPPLAATVALAANIKTNSIKAQMYSKSPFTLTFAAHLNTLIWKLCLVILLRSWKTSDHKAVKEVWIGCRSTS
jgi:hypothetical protein